MLRTRGANILHSVACTICLISCSNYRLPSDSEVYSDHSVDNGTLEGDDSSDHLIQELLSELEDDSYSFECYPNSSMEHEVIVTVSNSLMKDNRGLAENIIINTAKEYIREVALPDVLDVNSEYISSLGDHYIFRVEFLPEQNHLKIPDYLYDGDYCSCVVLAYAYLRKQSFKDEMSHIYKFEHSVVLTSDIVITSD